MYKEEGQCVVLYMVLLLALREFVDFPFESWNDDPN